MRIAAGIVGASGYSGMEAVRLCAAHPALSLRLCASDRWQGELVSSRTGGPGDGLRYAPLEKALELARECQVVLLCTPVEASLELVPQLLAAGLRVIDLSGAFRLSSPAAFEGAYGLVHRQEAFLAEAVYGLPELSRERLPAARLVSNPGCYATAAALSLSPLYRAGLLDAEAPVIDAASGTTGAGRKASEESSFSEVDGDFRAYRVLRHQHTPEIAQSFAREAGRAVPLTFTAHLLPVRRGILSTAYARLLPGRTAADVREAFMHIYAGSPFVSLAPSPDQVSLRAVVGTNRCQIGFAVDEKHDPGRVVVVAALDNLLKGAAGQAIQNLNLMSGLSEEAGLGALRGFFP